jgi:hypothetical protein
LKPPLLHSLQENSVIISLANLQFGADEVKPEYYQIQYRQVNESIYTNFSDVKQILPSLKMKTYEINNVTTKMHAYKIRIILIVQNKSFTDNVPELLTYKKTLHATLVDSKSLLIHWENIEKGRSFKYTVEYEVCIAESLF